jgi:hypothetical protein
MVPQLQRIAEPFGIPVYSGGGFDSITEKRRQAMKWSDLDQPITLLHLGDLDPSGVHMFETLARNLIAYGRDEGAEDIEAERIAILPRQTAGLPAAPPKPTDNRGFDKMLVSVSSDDVSSDDEDGEDDVGSYIAIDPTKTWQLEALPPDELARIVRIAIEVRLDREAYDEVLEEEEEVRAKVLARLDGNPPNGGGGGGLPPTRPWITRPT